jgi:hypothetical protein
MDPRPLVSLPSLQTTPAPPPSSIPLSTSPPLAAPPSFSLPPPRDLKAAAATEAGVPPLEAGAAASRRAS